VREEYAVMSRKEIRRHRRVLIELSRVREAIKDGRVEPLSIPTDKATLLELWPADAKAKRQEDPRKKR